MFERTASLWRRIWHPHSSSSGVGTAEAERRVTVRFSTEGELRYQPANTPDQEPCVAQVRNISVGGVNLVTNRKFSPGDLLNLELGGQDGAPTKWVLACVVHVTSL